MSVKSYLSVDRWDPSCYSCGHSKNAGNRMDNLTRIQDIAEERIRDGGYGAFSFREIAKEIGIKSSSVHYHFPTKADLAAAVARRYTERFLQRVEEDSEGLPSGERLLIFIDLFRQARVRDQKMCLCGVLAAESASLPAEVTREAREFFLRNLAWLGVVFEEAGLDGDASDRQATALLASLEGALLLSQVTGDDRAFDAILEQLKTLLSGPIAALRKDGE